jgi:hypothetical protein
VNRSIAAGFRSRKTEPPILQARAYIHAMRRYRLDPDNLRQLTPDEARRLDEAAIDYSDIPELDDEFFARARTMKRSLLDDLPTAPLFGEEWVTALLLQMLVEHCRIMGRTDELNSAGIAANEDAMRELDGELIEITHETHDRIFAKVTAEGRALLERLQAELDADEQRRQAHERSKLPR